MNPISVNEGSAFDAALMKKLMWKIIPFLMLLYFVAYLDRVNISFASLQMNADIGLSSIAYGFGASMFFIGYFHRCSAISLRSADPPASAGRRSRGSAPETLR